MIRLVLFGFVVYQLFTLPSGTSVIQNGIGGGVLAVIALVIGGVIWAVIHHDDNHPFQPWGIGTLF